MHVEYYLVTYRDTDLANSQWSAEVLTPIKQVASVRFIELAAYESHHVQLWSCNTSWPDYENHLEVDRPGTAETGPYHEAHVGFLRQAPEPGSSLYSWKFLEICNYPYTETIKMLDQVVKDPVVLYVNITSGFYEMQALQYSRDPERQSSFPDYRSEEHSAHIATGVVTRCP